MIFPAVIRAFLRCATAAAARTAIGAGTSSVTLPIAESDVTNLVSDLAAKQPLDADLTAIAGLASAADKLPYATGAQAWALSAFTAFGRSLVDDADAATARGTLGITTGLKLYIKDSAGTPHYWQLTITVLGVLTTADVGTSAPTDGIIFNA